MRFTAFISITKTLQVEYYSFTHGANKWVNFAYKFSESENSFVNKREIYFQNGRKRGQPLKFLAIGLFLLCFFEFFCMIFVLTNLRT